MRGPEALEPTGGVPVFTAEQVRKRFHASGVSVTDWAQKHGFSRQIVYSLLSGRTRGNRGVAHAAAVALGLKLEMDISELNLVNRRGERAQEQALTDARTHGSVP